MMTKERMELLFIVLFRYIRKIRSEQLKKVANLAASKADVVAQKAKEVLPVMTK